MTIHSAVQWDGLPIYLRNFLESVLEDKKNLLERNLAPTHRIDISFCKTQTFLQVSDRKDYVSYSSNKIIVKKEDLNFFNFFFCNVSFFIVFFMVYISVKYTSLVVTLARYRQVSCYQAGHQDTLLLYTLNTTYTLYKVHFVIYQ